MKYFERQHMILNDIPIISGFTFQHINEEDKNYIEVDEFINKFFTKLNIEIKKNDLISRKKNYYNGTIICKEDESVRLSYMVYFYFKKLFLDFKKFEYSDNYISVKLYQSEEKFQLQFSDLFINNITVSEKWLIAAHITPQLQSSIKQYSNKCMVLYDYISKKIEQFKVKGEINILEDIPELINEIKPLLKEIASAVKQLKQEGDDISLNKIENLDEFINKYNYNNKYFLDIIITKPKEESTVFDSISFIVRYLEKNSGSGIIYLLTSLNWLPFPREGVFKDDEIYYSLIKSDFYGGNIIKYNVSGFSLEYNLYIYILAQGKRDDLKKQFLKSFNTLFRELIQNKEKEINIQMNVIKDQIKENFNEIVNYSEKFKNNIKRLKDIIYGTTQAVEENQLLAFEEKNIYIKKLDELNVLLNLISKESDYLNKNVFPLDSMPQVAEDIKSDLSWQNIKKQFGYLKDVGIYISGEILKQYHCAINSGNKFVILDGISGTGKTLLSILYPAAVYGIISELVIDNKPQFNDLIKNILYILEDELKVLKVVSIKSNPDRQFDLLGNSLDHKFTKGFLYDFLLKEDISTEFDRFLIIDEMNILNPEHYFSKILDAMDTKKTITIHDDEKIYSEEKIPFSFSYPDNLHITGIVNIDESTKKISQKLINKCWYIEVRPDFEEFRKKIDSAYKEYVEIIESINDIFENTKVGIGFHDWNYIYDYIKESEASGFDKKYFFAKALCFRILPKIKTITSKERQNIEKLRLLAHKHNLKEIEEKINKMQQKMVLKPHKSPKK